MNLNIDFDELALEIDSEMDQLFDFIDKKKSKNSSYVSNQQIDATETKSVRKTTKTVKTEANV